MTVELLLLLVALWIVFGLIDAWALHRLGHSDWRWTIVCVLTGPLSVSVLYDQRYLSGRDRAADDTRPQDVTEAPSVEVEDEPVTVDTPSEDWPRDDPEGRLLLQGYRSLADH